MGIFGLPWNHPAIAVNMAAISLYVIHDLIGISIGALPSGISVYYRAPLAGLAMAGMSVYCFGESNSRLNLVVGYAMALFNLLCGAAFMAIGIAYISGPDSALWKLLLS
jgi:hypothetical protein